VLAGPFNKLLLLLSLYLSAVRPSQSSDEMSIGLTLFLLVGDATSFSSLPQTTLMQEPPVCGNQFLELSPFRIAEETLSLSVTGNRGGPPLSAPPSCPLRQAAGSAARRE